MEFSIVILDTSKFGGDTGFLVREISRHFAEWAKQIKKASYSLQVVKRTLVLTTSSTELVQRWYHIEHAYVEYMLKPDRGTEGRTSNIAA